MHLQSVTYFVCNITTSSSTISNTFTTIKTGRTNNHQSVEKLTGSGHHSHRVQTGEHHGLRCHRLQIVLVALPELGTDLRLRLAHVVDGALDSDDALQVERADVVDARNSDLSVSLLHDALDCVAAFADYAPD